MLSAGVCIMKQQIAGTSERKGVNSPNGKEEEEIHTKMIRPQNRQQININKELLVAES